MAITFDCSACGSPKGEGCLVTTFCYQCRLADRRLRAQNERLWKEGEKVLQRASVLDALYENAGDANPAP